MAIKAGQIIHDVNGFVVDRIQTGGVSSLNIPEEKIHELGNYQTVATVRDIPDLQFQMQSLDVSTEIEALLVGTDPTTLVDGNSVDFANSMPIDVVSPFKGAGVYTVVKGIVVPYLTLDSISYKFGLRQNAGQTVQLKGDSVYYVPGTPKRQTYSLTAATNTTYTFANTALAYTESGNTLYALSACVKNPTTHAYKRLFFGEDFTNTSSGITVLANNVPAGYTQLHVTYGTSTVGTYDQTVHQGTSVKPAAVRAKDIDVYISDGTATPTMKRWTGVQSFDLTRSVALQNDEEFGNTHFVSSDYDVADVKGSVQVKPVDADDLWSKMAQIANVNTSVIVGPYTSVTLPVELRISDPDSGTLLKTLYVPDARFSIPAVSGQVQQKLTTTFNFTSDSGSMQVFKGAR